MSVPAQRHGESRQDVAPWTLHSGDCLDSVTGIASLPDGSVDHVMCDPPYSEYTHSKVRRGGSFHAPDATEGPKRATISTSVVLGFDAITQEQREACADAFARVARRWILVFCDVESSHLWAGALRSTGVLEYVRTMAWIKVGGTPQFTGDRPGIGFEAIVVAHPVGRKRWNGGGAHGVYSETIVQGGREERVHTTQKPLALMESLVRDFTDPGETILDPFAGSGTTGVAAIRLGRSFIGWEREPKYYEIARKRLDGTREQTDLFRPQATKGKQASLLDVFAAAPAPQKGAA